MRNAFLWKDENKSEEVKIGKSSYNSIVESWNKFNQCSWKIQVSCSHWDRGVSKNASTIQLTDKIDHSYAVAQTRLRDCSQKPFKP
jgi:hypothetical protein